MTTILFLFIHSHSVIRSAYLTAKAQRRKEFNERSRMTTILILFTHSRSVIRSAYLTAKEQRRKEFQERFQFTITFIHFTHSRTVFDSLYFSRKWVSKHVPTDKSGVTVPYLQIDKQTNYTQITLFTKVLLMEDWKRMKKAAR